MKTKLLYLSIALNLVLLAMVFLGVRQSLNVRSLLSKDVVRTNSHFQVVDTQTRDIVFVGDSITRAGLWNEMFPEADIANRGVNGNTAQDVFDRLALIGKLKPRKVFLMIGVNDLNTKRRVSHIIQTYEELFDYIAVTLPGSDIYVQSVLPVNSDWPRVSNDDVRELNQALRRLASEKDYVFIDLNSKFSDSSGALKAEYSNDGLHLLGSGYELWRDEIADFVTAVE